MPRAKSKCIPPWCRKEIQAAPSWGSISIGDKVTRACHCILPGTLATKPNLLPKKMLHIRPKITEIVSLFFFSNVLQMVVVVKERKAITMSLSGEMWPQKTWLPDVKERRYEKNYLLMSPVIILTVRILLQVSLFTALLKMVMMP